MVTFPLCPLCLPLCVFVSVDARACVLLCVFALLNRPRLASMIKHKDSYFQKKPKDIDSRYSRQWPP